MWLSIKTSIYGSLALYLVSPGLIVFIVFFFQENSFLQALGHVELDLPEPPEKAPRPPPQSVDPYSRYGPKAQIVHIFRAPDKRPPEQLSLAFLGLTILPFIIFLVGVSFFFFF